MGAVTAVTVGDHRWSRVAMTDCTEWVDVEWMSGNGRCVCSDPEEMVQRAWVPVVEKHSP